MRSFSDLRSGCEGGGVLIAKAGTGRCSSRRASFGAWLLLLSGLSPWYNRVELVGGDEVRVFDSLIGVLKIVEGVGSVSCFKQIIGSCAGKTNLVASRS